MTGGLLQLAAYGAQDAILTGNPQMSLFVSSYKRHTNFALESTQQFFNGDIGFGKKCSCKLERVGDLVQQVFLDVKIPSLVGVNSPKDLNIRWSSNIGHALIEYVEIEIGGKVIDKQYGIWMNIWSELVTPGDIQGALDEMIGSEGAVKEEQHLHIPLYFWFCRHPGLALPLIALQYQEVCINVSFTPLHRLLSSDKSMDTVLSAINQCNCEINILEASLYVDYIFLEDEERKLFAQRKHNYLIEQIQFNTESFKTGQTDIIFNLDLHHPVKELIWVIQGENNLTMSSTYNMFTYNTGPTGPMINAELQFEGNPRIKVRNNLYFRAVQPYQRHTYAPKDRYIYVYSFAQEPEKLQPTGTCNFSRIDNANFYFTLIENKTITFTNPRVMLFAPNYNVLQIAKGMAGLAYI